MCEESFDGTYLIENEETQRYVFQTGDPIKGNRGAEGGWKASSGFEAPKVVGADANYYNRAYWKFIPQGDGKYFIENVETKRYLFQDGKPINGDRGAEGGWKASSGFEAPNVVGADANYYNRAYWKIIPQGSGRYFIENAETKRYLFQDGGKIKGKRGDEGGWLASSGFESPSVVGADANYYNLAYFKITKVDVQPEEEEKFEGVYFIENAETQRYVFQAGHPIKGDRGAEGGWKASSGFEAPKVVGADANYYNRAYWKFIPQGDGKYFIENVETKRYLFQDGKPIKGDRGAEGGWKASSGFEAPNVVGADANYYNRAYWKIIPQGSGRYFIENVETKRYLFQDGGKIKGKRGDEGGWLASSGFESPSVVGADANYYNLAYFKIIKV